LARAAAVAVVDVAADDDPEADAETRGDGEEVLDVATAPVQALGDRERVHVVVDHHRDPEPLMEQVAERYVLPAERRRADGAPFGVHDTRDAEPDAEERAVRGGR